MAPVNVIPPPPPLNEFQKHALTLYIRKKRAYYQKKDAVIERKYKWLEDLNQRDPDLEDIEISLSSLEELKKKRENLSEEKHKLFEKLKNLIPEEEEQAQYPASQFPPHHLHSYSGFGPVTAGQPSNYLQTTYSSYNTPSYTLVTEPITPKKPSEMSPAHPGSQPMMSPLSSHDRGSFSSRPWDSKPFDTKEDRMDSFTKVFADTISKAKMSELNMMDHGLKKEDISPVKISDIKPELLSPRRQRELSVPEPKKPDVPVDVPRKPEPKTTPEMVRRQLEAKVPEGSQRRNSDGKPPVEVKSGNRARKSVSGTESNSSISSKHLSQSPHLKKKEEESDLPPVIKISRAEIHSKVMSWPTASHPFPKKEADKKPKKEGNDPGSSLLEFAFQSALFGNTLFNEAAREASPAVNSSTQQQQGPKTPPETTPRRHPPKTPPPSTPTSSGSDLLTALSMSYGSGLPRKQEKELEKSRKRERSPDIRSPSPELVTLYKTEPEKPEKKEEEKVKPKEGEKSKSSLPPPPPPPPPPKSSSKKGLSSPATSSMGYAPMSPSNPPVGYPVSSAAPMTYPSTSPHSYPGYPLSFLSPTHHPQFPQYGTHKSPTIRSPMLAPYPTLPPHSPNIGMFPPPPGLPPHMPPLPPPPHLLHPQPKTRYPSNRYL